MEYSVRLEERDAHRIRQITGVFLAVAEHSSGTERAMIDTLRMAHALTVSLVAARDGDIAGHAAFSPVKIDGLDVGWFGPGPVSAVPGLQGKGIEGALIEEGLKRLKAGGSKGCVVLGDPKFY
ncbi:GNAT family N-acetyltransferase [Microvirga pakistanensis]|uniref:GNAT family N-acetyltransferase n=1 Tax=Microvirga pakistanensis TaxID=1682650 RepID=UPI001FCE94B2|nr:N-acetyltransferase [Microvirga pakistanensis]